MKIALVILHADASRGGAERYTLDLAEGLVKRGHDVSILASSFQDAPTAGKRIVLRSDGLARTERFKRFNHELLWGEIENGFPFDVIHAMLPVWACDIYHPHAGIAAEALASGHLTNRGRIQQALARAGNLLNLRRREFARVERKLLRSPNAPLVFCLSNLIKDVVKRHYPGLADDKLISLFNGIDLHKFDPNSNPQARQVVRDRFKIAGDAVVGLMLAQDFERKGLATAIRAMSLLKDSKLVLVVGGKPDATAYRRLAEQLGVTDRVVFTGPVDRPVDFYQAADFFVLPTRFDPCSLVVLEALAMGLPVISTSRNGACEVMTDGIHGRVLNDPEDVPALAGAMREMINPFRRAEFADACLGLRSELSQERHLDKVEAAYVRISQMRQKGAETEVSRMPYSPSGPIK